MSELINAYCTQRELPDLTFPHRLQGRRDLGDPELVPHLQGFTNYIVQQAGGEVTAITYSVLRHLQRVRHHLSLEVEKDDLDDFTAWAWAANAICFMRDGTVRDPEGAVLFEPGDDPDPEAVVPYPQEARARRERTTRSLRDQGLVVPDHLPPVVGDGEVVMRSVEDVEKRAVSLLMVALRAESIHSGQPIPVEEMKENIPGGYEAMTSAERKFFDDDSPEAQAVVDACWRYEALQVLEWAMQLLPELPPPSGICDAGAVTAGLFRGGIEANLAFARLRPVAEILDQLDLHFRLHWLVRNAQTEGAPSAGGIDPGVVFERHHALNWLTRFEDAEWDDVETPT